MPNGKALNVYVPNELVASLDAIAAAMGQGELGIQPTRSQLVTKAIENFVERCKAREDLKRAVEQVEKLAEIKRVKKEPIAAGKILRVVSPAS